MEHAGKPLLTVLNGKPVWPPPIWLMRQAGRYLPEYRAVRAQVPNFVALCLDPARACEVTLQPLRRFGFDAAILFSDILILPWALGYGLSFREGEGPVMPKLQDAAQLAALAPERVAAAAAPVMETVGRVRAQLAPEGFPATALIGFAGAPFTVACYMVEGGGSRDFAAVRALAYGNPGLFDALITLLTEATIAYLSAQAAAGAEALMLFDSWAGVLSPSLFRRYVIAPCRTIVQRLRSLHPDVPVIGFPRLAGLMLGEYAASAGVQGVGLDTGMEPARAIAAVGQEVAVQGNLDPMALVAGGPALARETDGILAGLRDRRLIFNLGHGIVPHTPIEHVAALVERVRAA